jgi:sugar phosphate isomerase/epimerase
MLKAISTYVFIKERLNAGLLDALQRGGAEAIEIFGARDHFDYTNRAHVKEVAGWFQSTGVQFHSLHAPMWSDYEWGRAGEPPVNVCDNDKRRRIESMDEIKRAIETAELAPFRFLVQHLGVGGEHFDQRKFDDALTAVEHLRAFAKPLGVTVLLENIPNEIATPEKLVELVHAGHFNDVGFCFDTGHAHIMSRVDQAFEVMKDNIRSTHVHDNAGDRDAHLWPGEGSIDWDETLNALRSAPHVPALLFEIEPDPQKTPAAISSKAAEVFGKLGETGATERRGQRV